MASTMCACGRSLHYTDPAIQQQLEDLCEELGEEIQVCISGTKMKVQRHFITLHGIRAQDRMRYGVEGVYRRAAES